MKLNLLLLIFMIIIINCSLSLGETYQPNAPLSQETPNNWYSTPLSNTSLIIQQESTDSPTVIRLNDLLHEEKKKQQYAIQETLLDLIIGVFVIILDIILIGYYILELWFLYKLLSDWIPSLFLKGSNALGEFIGKTRSKK